MDSIPSWPSSSLPGLDLISIAQFDAEHAARRQHTPEPTSSNKRQKPDPCKSSSLSAAHKVLLPSKPLGDCIAKVNNLAQKHHLRADYEIEEGPRFVFSAVLRLQEGDQTVRTYEALGISGSKKAAKEKAAELALRWLEMQPVPKKKQSLPLVIEKVDLTENWVGVLHEFCQAAHRDQPEYSIYELGIQRFGAACFVFGKSHHDHTAAFASKKVAKTAAARAAVLALREEAVLPKHGIVIRSGNAAPKVPSFGSPLPVAPTSAVQGTPPMHSTLLASHSSVSALATSLPLTTTTYSLVTQLCTSLNLPPPEYKLTQTSSQTPDFWDGAAYFCNVIEPELRGAVGKVQRVYGKKNAKDKVVQQVLEILERIKEQRLAC